jgi:hypothetical protein
MSAYTDLVKKIKASNATPEQKKNALAAAAQANKTGKGISVNETTYILNNVTTVTPQNLGTAAQRKAANAAGTTVGASAPAATAAAEPAAPAGPTPEETAAAKAKADADAAAAKADADRTKTNKDLFRLVMGQAFDLKKDGGWIDSLFDSAKQFYDQGITGDSVVELLLKQENAPKAFTDRFRIYLDKDAADTAAGKQPRFGNIATFLATEKAIGDKLSSYGNAFQKLNTQENINKFLSGDVAADEVGRRIDNAYYAINSADAALKEQIRNQFPSLDDDALAASLVTGDVDSIQQQIKFGAAGIAASAKLAGYTPVSNLEDLTKQGVTREGALKSFQEVTAERAGIQQASRLFGGAAPTQAELEAEALGTGAQSTAANRLRSQARAQFAGQSGITTGSLKRKSQV